MIELVIAWPAKALVHIIYLYWFKFMVGESLGWDTLLLVYLKQYSKPAHIKVGLSPTTPVHIKVKRRSR